MNNATLPSMDDFIRNLDRDHSSNFIEASQDCSICSSNLFPNDLPGGHGGFKRMPPCSHLFYNQCIKDNLDSIAAQRNCCPNCRAELCVLNVLCPEKEAARQAMENAHVDALNDFNTGVYANIMHRIEQAFEIQKFRYRAQHREGYTRIVSEVRQDWYNDGFEGARCCHDHVRMGWD